MDEQLRASLKAKLGDGSASFGKDDLRRAIGAVRRKQFMSRLAVMAAAVVAAGCAVWDYRVFTQVEVPAAEDRLVAISPDQQVFVKLEEYVNYLVGKVNLGGRDAIEGKWAAESPPEYRRDAWRKLSDLGSGGFKVEGVSGDKVNYYVVACRANRRHGGLVFVEVKRERIGGELIYRLCRVY
jgi:hypothetical protein